MCNTSVEGFVCCNYLLKLTNVFHLAIQIRFCMSNVYRFLPSPLFVLQFLKLGTIDELSYLSVLQCPKIILCTYMNFYWYANYSFLFVIYFTVTISSMLIENVFSAGVMRREI